MLRLLHVLGQVDQDRARAAVGRDEEGFLYDAGEILDVLDQVVVLGAGTRDAHHVGLLEGVVADHGGGTCPVITTSGIESM